MPQVIIENSRVNSLFDEPTVRSYEGTIKRARSGGPRSYCAPPAKAKKVPHLFHFGSREQVDRISIQESSTGYGAA